MVTKEFSKQLPLIFKKLEHEGIDSKSACIFLKKDSEHFALALVGQGQRIMNPAALEEAYPLIYGIFSKRRDISVIIYSRPKYCLEASLKYSSIPPVLDDMAQIVGVRAEVCDFEQTERIVKILKKGNACLIRPRSEGEPGAIAVGPSPERAFAAAIILEKSAQALVESEYLGGANSLSPAIAWLFSKAYALSYSKKDEEIASQTERDIPRPIPEEELSLRKALVECGKKMAEENLVQGTWGNISARIDERYMLVTPSGLAYNRLSVYDIVRVDMHSMKHEGRLKPTTEKGIHARLLSEHSRFNCIIHSHSVNCSVFAAARQALPITGAAERELLGEEAAIAKTRLPGSKGLVNAVAEAINSDSCACIMGSHGMLVCGSSIEDALDKCRAMEKAARDQIDRLAKAAG